MDSPAFWSILLKETDFMRTIIHSGLMPGKLFLLIKHTLCSVCFTASLSMPLYAIEFNTDMIDAEDRKNIDLSQFEKKAIFLSAPM
jgi:hypothetical protein